MYELSNKPIQISGEIHKPPLPIFRKTSATEIFAQNSFSKSTELKINETISELLRSDDHLKLGQQHVSTMTIILTSNLIGIIVVGIGLYIAFRSWTLRKKIVRYDVTSGLLSYPGHKGDKSKEDSLIVSSRM